MLKIWSADKYEKFWIKTLCCNAFSFMLEMYFFDNPFTRVY